MAIYNNDLKDLFELISSQFGEATGALAKHEIDKLLSLHQIDLTELTAKVATLQSVLDADEGTPEYDVSKNILSMLSNLTVRVGKNEVDISNLSATVKAGFLKVQADFADEIAALHVRVDDLTTTVDELSNTTQETFESVVNTITSEAARLDATDAQAKVDLDAEIRRATAAEKANLEAAVQLKADLAVTDSTIGALADRLGVEELARAAKDTDLQIQIDALKADPSDSNALKNLTLIVNNYIIKADNGRKSLRDALDKEILDRSNGDVKVATDVLNSVSVTLGDLKIEINANIADSQAITLAQVTKIEKALTTSITDLTTSVVTIGNGLEAVKLTIADVQESLVKSITIIQSNLSVFSQATDKRLGDLEAGLAAEVARAVAAEKVNSSAITLLKTQITTSVASLQSAINKEALRAIAAENSKVDKSEVQSIVGAELVGLFVSGIQKYVPDFKFAQPSIEGQPSVAPPAP